MEYLPYISIIKLIDMKNLVLVLVLLVSGIGFSQTNVFADVDFYPEVSTNHLQYADSIVGSDFWDTETYSELIILYINEERRLHDLSPLVKDDELMKFAQKHTDWMCKTGKYEHSGENIKEVIRHGKMSDCKVSIHHALSAQSCVRAWMNSPGHRKHLLNPNLTKIGAGYGRNHLGGYETAVFR